jgi:putative transposase
MMGAVHLLPGTTFSNVKARGSYQSEKNASMSFHDLERWLAEEIAGQYHNRPHRGLGGITPAAAWEAAWRTADGSPTIPPMIGDARAFVIGFYPSASRRVSRSGIVLHGLHYWDPCLTPLINDGKSHEVHYSQRDLSKVYLRLGDGYVDVPLLDRSQGAFSFWELREAKADLRGRGLASAANSEMFDSIQRQRSIQAEAESKSKAARKKTARTPEAASPSASSDVDYTRTVEIFDWDAGVIE